MVRITRSTKKQLQVIKKNKNHNLKHFPTSSNAHLWELEIQAVEVEWHANSEHYSINKIAVSQKTNEPKKQVAVIIPKTTKKPVAFILKKQIFCQV